MMSLVTEIYIIIGHEFKVLTFKLLAMLLILKITSNFKEKY